MESVEKNNTDEVIGMKRTVEFERAIWNVDLVAEQGKSALTFAVSIN